MSQVKRKNNKILGLYGAGGHGRETMNQIIKLIENNDLDFYKTNIYFIESQKKYQKVNDIPVLSLDEFCAIEHYEKYFNISVADHKTRKILANKCLNMDLIPISIYSKLSSVGSNNAIDVGSLISEFSLITTNTRIGRFLHLNRYASISHDCVVGDFVTFGPYASCNGNVIIENGAYIGSGAIIKQGVVVGKNSIVGMGAVVTRDVKPYTTVVGNPAKELKK